MTFKIWGNCSVMEPAQVRCFAVVVVHSNGIASQFTDCD